ncbi:DUF2515 family protein [Paenibacillus sp. 481]|uniref:DUF2515 family protein n=1 Tax=Paenibacillus sp. 481 TaxID=2835869 RepID=UPI001E3AA88D|nr:DUF2515 family protein [Paenibacillus sp. 481]UHA74616.1 DUF2515 family protein [Paenibacillus sp. 481]
MDSQPFKRWRHALNFVQTALETTLRAVQSAWGQMTGKWLHPSDQHQLKWNDATAKRVEQDVCRILQERHRATHHTLPSLTLTTDELALIRRIHHAVRKNNRNNITRTDAYREIYLAFPEIHWALLAHVVSRNGGWNMTDLQGKWLPQLLSAEHRLWIFRMLERANALIFHDAYSQLLLYSESRKLGKSMFHLLPHFGVSSFMTPFWHSFWVQQESALLTVALIMNEQNVIEGRVIQNEQYREHVLDRVDFALRGQLQMNQILFPLELSQENTLHEHRAHKIGLSGLTLENFKNIDERIELGKSLYALLFCTPDIHAGVLRFIQTVPHSGSRADYWPAQFTVDGTPSATTRSGQVYSPKLQDVWEDQLHPPLEQGDWFIDDRMLKHLTPATCPLDTDMTEQHARYWAELEEAVEFSSAT